MEDFIVANASGGVAGSGSLASRLLGCQMNSNALRVSDVLRFREWALFDEAVVAVARQRLVVIKDLISEGLTFPVENALGTTRVDWETISEMTDAQVDMSGISDGQNDRVTYVLNSVPLPITHKDFKINIRALEASRKYGETLDMSQAKLSARIVTERLEKMVFAGYSIPMIGSTIYGLTTEPNRKTGSITSDWSAGTTTGETILLDTLNMIKTLAVSPNNMYGPYALYLPYAAYNRLADDFKVYGSKTIGERLMDIPELKYIRGTNNLTSNNTVLVQMTDDVIDLVDGMEPTTVQWDEHGGLQVNMKIMAMMVPRVKSTQSAQSGIAHFS